MQPYDFGALALRLMIAAEFFPTGWSTVRDPVGRGTREGMPPGFMIFIGVAEMAGGIQKKIFAWHTGFWSKDAYGWHYDLTLATMNLMIALSGPGRVSLLP